MKKISVFLILTLLLTSLFSIFAYADSDSTKADDLTTIYYINGDWQYQPVSIEAGSEDKNLKALNYLVSGSNLPEGCFNEFPEDFKIEAYQVKGNVASISVSQDNISKIDEVNFSKDVITDILSYNIFQFDTEIKKVNILCGDDVYKTVKKADLFEAKIDPEKEKKVKEKVKELEEKFKGMSQKEIVEYIENEKAGTPTVTATASNFIVVLDPGHGGSDPGAVGTYNGTQYNEKDINLAIAKAAKTELLNHSGISVLMTRSTDVSMSINSRYLYANNNNATCFVSVHINSNTSSTPKGCTAIYPNNHDISVSEILADIVVDNIVNRTSLIKNTDPYMDVRNLGVLRYTNMPAIISESGFMSNSSDLAYLITSSGKTTIGGQIGYSIWYWLEYWG